MNNIIIPKSKINKTNCNSLLIPKEVCYIKFNSSNEKYSCSVDEIKLGKKNINLFTVREEMVILDFNNRNQLIGIELLDSKKAVKPCMKTKRG